MCFSISASFVAGASLLAIGAMTVKKARRNAELPFAAIPLLFGVQQIIEGIIFVAVYHIYTLWFISVWCFFAAVLSAVVYLHFRTRERHAVSA